MRFRDASGVGSTLGSTLGSQSQSQSQARFVLLLEEAGELGFASRSVVRAPATMPTTLDSPGVLLLVAQAAAEENNKLLEEKQDTLQLVVVFLGVQRRRIAGCELQVADCRLGEVVQ